MNTPIQPGNFFIRYFNARSAQHQSFITQQEQYFEVWWFRSGNGELIVDDVSYSVAPNTIFCIAPQQMRYIQPAGSMQAYCLGFTTDFLSPWILQTEGIAWFCSYVANKQVHICTPSKDVLHDMADVMQKMQKEYDQHGLAHAAMLSALLCVMMMYCFRQLQSEDYAFTYTRNREMTQKFIALVKQHFITRRAVADYASELCITTNHLNRIVKKVTGYTASYHIQQQVIAEAKRMAIQSNSSMKEIAYRIGFDDLAHFSRFFKNNSGINFSLFKKNCYSTTDLLSNKSNQPAAPVQ